MYGVMSFVWTVRGGLCDWPHVLIYARRVCEQTDELTPRVTIYVHTQSRVGSHAIADSGADTGRSVVDLSRPWESASQSPHNIARMHSPLHRRCRHRPQRHRRLHQPPPRLLCVQKTRLRVLQKLSLTYQSCSLLLPPLQPFNITLINVNTSDTRLDPLMAVSHLWSQLMAVPRSMYTSLVPSFLFSSLLFSSLLF